MLKEQRLNFFGSEESDASIIMRKINEAEAIMNEATDDLIGLVNMYENGTLSNVYENAGERVGEKLVSVCKACKNMLNTMRNGFVSIQSNIIKKAKSAINTSIKNTEIKDEYSVIQTKLFTMLNTLLKKSKEYAIQVKNSKGWEKYGNALILISIPLPVPGMTTGSIVIKKAIDILLGYINKFKNRDIDSAIDALEKCSSDIEKSGNSKMAATGAKLANNMRKCLSIANSQITKLSNEIKSKTN